MIFLWSFSFVLVDIAVEFIPPISLALYRFIIASISFIIIDIYSKLNKKTNENDLMMHNSQLKLTKKEWIFTLLSSFSGVSLFFLVQYSAIQQIGPSIPALFVCLLAPVIITLMSLSIFKEKLTKLKILGFGIASIGGFLLVTGGDIHSLTPNSPNFLGYILALATPLLWAIYSTLTKKLTKTISLFQILKYVAYFGTIELFIFVMINQEFIIFIQNVLNVVVVLCALYLGLGCYIIGYYIWQKSQKELKSSKVASFLYIEPFLTLVFSLLLQRSEVVLIWNVLGGLIVLVAVIMINYK